MDTARAPDEQLLREDFNPFYNFLHSKPVLVHQYTIQLHVFDCSELRLCNRCNSYDRLVFLQRPLLGPLLFENESSDARDHCANERSKAAL